MKKKILFIEANTTGTGMLAIRKAVSLGYEPVFITRNPSTYAGLTEMNCRVIVADTNAVESIAMCVEEENPALVSGVMTTSDYYLEATAQIAEQLGLRSNTRETIAVCRNKARLREVLHGGKVGQPQFQVITSANQLVEIDASFPLPCVVKPADDSGSNHVRLCTTWSEVEELTVQILANQTNARGQETAHTVLLEQYVEGHEYSVEMFTWQGESTCLGITEKRVTGFPYFVESGHLFSAKLPPFIEQEIIDTVNCALQTVGYQYGASHTEVKWTGERCVLIEINARLAGGMIPELVRHATGIDLLEQQLLCALGVAPVLDEIERKDHAGIHFLIAKENGTLTDVSGLEEVRRIPGFKELAVKARVGQSVQLPQNFSHRLGHVIVTGPTYEETVRRLKEVEQLLELQVHI
ncbi:ATP-grasp domain-containing protein [Paenibacillus sp. N1-5-1-14]|uniref:ATP-grasp domain-containing protein n=1 Tax=Paenibacillus radicibacter TaxID=2972488 RepID=UPI002158C357|nr:ATP-grasp domain-containing protein [Paenibacillus radicibacter]MCR8643274.1 ATP-grasp domain-containing protein [Paenibacillus radicibacter]